MYCSFNFVYIKTIFESTEMRIVQTIILLLLIACQSETSEKDIKPAQSQSSILQESSKESTQQPQKITNGIVFKDAQGNICLLYTSPSPRDKRQSRMPSSA